MATKKCMVTLYYKKLQVPNTKRHARSGQNLTMYASSPLWTAPPRRTGAVALQDKARQQSLEIFFGPTNNDAARVAILAARPCKPWCPTQFAAQSRTQLNATFTRLRTCREPTCCEPCPGCVAGRGGSRPSANLGGLRDDGRLYITAQERKAALGGQRCHFQLQRCLSARLQSCSCLVPEGCPRPTEAAATHPATGVQPGVLTDMACGGLCADLGLFVTPTRLENGEQHGRTACWLKSSNAKTPCRFTSGLGNVQDNPAAQRRWILRQEQAQLAAEAAKGQQQQQKQQQQTQQQPRRPRSPKKKPQQKKQQRQPS